MNTGSLGLVSSVSNTIFQTLVSFFEWDLEEFLRNGVDSENLLKWLFAFKGVADF